MRLAAMPLVLSLLVASALAQEADPAAAARLRQAWRSLPEVRGDSFRFLVMADNQPHANPERIAARPEFEGMVREANLLAPDLVLLAGDLIYGYEPDGATIHRMWDAFDAAVGELEAPFRMAPGNHDVWDPPSRTVWGERYGPLFHAFSVGGCRFLALNSEESLGTTDRIGPEQLAWIEKEVEAAKDARHLFVYLHKPLWRFEPGGDPWMEQVHPVLKRHPSVTVFGGHFHHYRKP